MHKARTPCHWKTYIWIPWSELSYNSRRTWLDGGKGGWEISNFLKSEILSKSFLSHICYHDELKNYGAPKICTLMQWNDQFSDLEGGRRNHLWLHLVKTSLYNCKTLRPFEMLSSFFVTKKAFRERFDKTINNDVITAHTAHSLFQVIPIWMNLNETHLPYSCTLPAEMFGGSACFMK